MSVGANMTQARLAEGMKPSPSSASGMAAAAFPRENRQGRETPKPDSSPLQGRDWAGKTVVTQNASGYVSMCESKPNFSRDAMRAIVTAGTELVQVAGGLVQAARQLQKNPVAQCPVRPRFHRGNTTLVPRYRRRSVGNLQAGRHSGVSPTTAEEGA